MRLLAATVGVASLLGGADAQAKGPGNAGGSEPSVAMSTDAVATDGISGYTTYHVSVTFGARAADVYALVRAAQPPPSCAAPPLSHQTPVRKQYGETGDGLDIPPAYQVAAPFGTNVGPTNPAFWPIMPDCQVCACPSLLAYAC